ncbi:MAG TPA: hypothetical protein PKC10_15625 [Cyclobacteriaceae bacterium]|nr:hypothetical protein [Cyclobacteriaceae bacterium]
MIPENAIYLQVQFGQIKNGCRGYGICKVTQINELPESERYHPTDGTGIAALFFETPGRMVMLFFEWSLTPGTRALYFDKKQKDDLIFQVEYKEYTAVNQGMLKTCERVSRKPEMRQCRETTY